MKRQRFAKALSEVSILSLLCLFLLAWTLQARAADSGATFAFLHLTDVHVVKLDGLQPKLVKNRGHYGNNYEPLRKALTTLPGQVGANAVIITGDLIDFYDGETTEGVLRAGEIDYFKPLTTLASVPTWLTLGNHDIHTSAVNPKFKSTSQPHPQVARADWIRQIDCFRNGTYYYRDVQTGGTPWRFYFLDDGYKLSAANTDNFWDRQQLDWLNNELNHSPERRAILCFHVPLTVGDTNGDGVTFPAPPEGWPLPETYKEGIFKILNEHPSVVAAFVGHNHKNVIEDIPLPSGHSVTQVETGAFGVDPNNWRVIKVGENSISISKPGSSDVERVVKLPPVVVPAATPIAEPAEKPAKKSAKKKKPVAAAVAP